MDVITINKDMTQVTQLLERLLKALEEILYIPAVGQLILEVTKIPNHLINLSMLDVIFGETGMISKIVILQWPVLLNIGVNMT